MITKLFTILDSVSKAHLQPFSFQRDEEATRSFAQLVNDPKKEHRFFSSPHDFTLFRIGTFDNKDASIALELAPIKIYNGAELIDHIKHAEQGQFDLTEINHET
nr:MAG: nonstructural protein [Microvirus sp.]